MNGNPGEFTGRDKKRVDDYDGDTRSVLGSPKVHTLQSDETKPFSCSLTSGSGRSAQGGNLATLRLYHRVVKLVS